MTDAIAQWIRDVHQALSADALQCRSAAWGPVTMAHRTTRPQWYAAMDDAWAFDGQGAPDLDVVTAAFEDLPPEIGPPPLRRGDLGPRGEVSFLAGSSVRLTWGEHSGQVTGWDPESGCAILLRHSPPNGYDLVSPMRWLVHWSVAAAGGVLMHAAAVGRSEAEVVRGALLIGDAGFGKSTTTLACLSQGWMTCGDDAVAVFPDGDRWSAASVYAAVKTKLAHAGRAPADLPQAGVETVTWEIEGTKRVHLLTATDERTLCERIEIEALVLLDPQASPEDACSPVDSATARTMATPSTLLTLPFDRERTLRRIGRLAEQVPAWRLPRRSTLARTVTDMTQIMDRSAPMISVIMPLYNGERYVQDAVESILQQTRGRFQIIAVDDAGTQPTLARVEAMRDRILAAGHRLDTVVHDENKGIAAARNAGAAVAVGDYITWLDQDDLWPPGRTADLLTALRDSSAAVARGRLQFVDLMPGVPRPWVRDIWFTGDHPGYVLGALLCRREFLDEVGLLDEDLRTGTDDVEWFMRLKDRGDAVVDLDAVSVIRRIHDDNQSGKAPAQDLLAAIRAHRARRSASDR